MYKSNTWDKKQQKISVPRKTHRCCKNSFWFFSLLLLFDGKYLLVIESCKSRATSTSRHSWSLFIARYRDASRARTHAHKRTRWVNSFTPTRTCISHFRGPLIEDRCTSRGSALCSVEMRVQSRLQWPRREKVQWRTGSLELSGPIRKSLVYDKEPCSRCRKYAINAPRRSIDCTTTRYMLADCNSNKSNFRYSIAEKRDFSSQFVSTNGEKKIIFVFLYIESCYFQIENILQRL